MLFVVLLYVVTMDEWQNRLRAQKQQDRQSKTQSAQILHSYRGSMKDEDEIQKRMKLEEQQKKKDAELYLRNYRPNVEDVEALASPKKQNQAKYDGPLPPVVGAPLKDDPRNTIAAGAVSSIAANFTGSGTPTGADVANSSETRTFDDTNGTVNISIATTVQLNNNANGAPPAQLDFSLVSGNNSQSTTDTAQEWVQVTSEEVPVVDDRGATSSKIVTVNDDADEPQFVRLDVDFSFGLISTRAQPAVDSYMEAVEDVVQGALQENGVMKEHISFDPMYSPFVENIQKDGMICWIGY